MTTDFIDTVVIGSGVIGLAIARKLAQLGHEVVVLEKNDHHGEETSSRNSEVIHAGIYYSKNSLKAQLCVAGRDLLYEYCATHPVTCSQVGKLIVATQEDQLGVLTEYKDQAFANGVSDLTWLDADQVKMMEPNVAALAGLFSPSTGILDTHEFMLSLLGDLERNGGLWVGRSLVTSIKSLSDSPTAAGNKTNFLVSTSQSEIRCNKLIIAAGHDSALLARDLYNTPPTYYATGHYYTYAGPPPFQRLVYPVAQRGGLGVHVTVDLGGQVKFGPDVRWIDSLDYQFDDSRRGQFIKAIRAYFPALDEERLQPGYTGVRPKISGPNEPAADFRIDDVTTHGIEGLIALFGIESPGITASLAIANQVARVLHAT